MSVPPVVDDDIQYFTKNSPKYRFQHGRAWLGGDDRPNPDAVYHLPPGPGAVRHPGAAGQCHGVFRAV